jgi:hypothetical protein
MSPSNTSVILAVLAFLGTIGLLALTSAVAVWAMVSGRMALARRLGLGASGLAAGYLLVLVSAGALSGDMALPPGAEKYFCELDCHLAYSLTGLKQVEGAPPGDTRWALTLRTRFDENTIAPWRGREAPTWPGPRRVELRDGSGRSFAPGGEAPGSVPITRELRPAESYETVLLFDLPVDARPAQLLLEDDMFISRLLIGQEPSPFHGKTLLALP